MTACPFCWEAGKKSIGTAIARNKHHASAELQDKACSVWTFLGLPIDLFHILWQQFL